MGNPLRSEEEAFRWVLVIAAGAGTVIALALLVRPSVGVVWAAALLGFAAGFAYRGRRDARGAGGTHRLLAVTDREVGRGPLLEELLARGRGRDCEVLLLMLWAAEAANGDADPEAAERARQRMELSLIAIERAGLRVRGEVAGTDPEQAVERALGGFDADEIVSATDPPLHRPLRVAQGSSPAGPRDGPPLTLVGPGPGAPAVRP